MDRQEVRRQRRELTRMRRCADRLLCVVFHARFRWTARWREPDRASQASEDKATTEAVWSL